MLKPSEQGSIFWRQIDLRSRMIRFTLKMKIFPSISLEAPSIRVLKPSEQGLDLSKTIDLRSHMPRFTLKLNIFSSISLETPYMCVENHWEQGSCFWDDWFEGHMLRFTLQNECFPIYLLGNPFNMCWNPQNKAHWLSEMIDWRGHMPRFTSKIEHFFIYLIGNPINVCWNPQNRACFSKTI